MTELKKLYPLLQEWYDDHNFAIPEGEYFQKINEILWDFDELVKLWQKYNVLGTRIDSMKDTFEKDNRRVDQIFLKYSWLT